MSAQGIVTRQGGDATAAPGAKRVEPGPKGAPNAVGTTPLHTLADAVEAATGPDRALDAAILKDQPGVRHKLAKAGGLRPRGSDVEVFEREWLIRNAPHYTASLDAATTLIPAGYDWGVGGGPGDAWAWCDGSGNWNEGMRIEAAAPALALTAAALRALAQIGESNG